MTAEPPNPWDDALLAASMIAVDPQGLGGVHLRARAGVVRDSWLENVMAAFDPDIPLRRIASGISEARLTGGLDIGATIEAGRPVIETGVLAAADGGALVLAMAERLDPSAAAVIGAALDDGAVRVERDGISAKQSARFALVALDEGIDDDEGLAPALADRLGLRIDLNAVGWRQTDRSVDHGTIAEAKAILRSVSIDDPIIEALCAVALSVGVPSMRASLQLVRAARVAAALRGSIEVQVDDARTSLRLVLGLQSAEPQHQEERPPQQEKPESPPDQLQEEQKAQTADMLQDVVVEAAEAVLPQHLLASLDVGPPRRGGSGAAGKAGAMRNRARRGRAIGIAERPPTPGARLDVLSTLRQAAPWQRIRAQAKAGTDAPASRLHIRKEDFRYIRRREKMGTTAVFAVDASGSAAVERLAETKGAVELLLAECYVRRDSVALVAFRGKSAETLLEPTRSLTRAKRSLSALPGGGGTPLAGGILAALAMATGAFRKGQSAVTVFLTDGRGNVALDGTSGRERVGEDTSKAARLFRGSGLRSILIDTAQRPQARAQALALELGAEYLALPRGGAKTMAREIGARMGG